MNDKSGTAANLVAAATQLFSQNGYDGTSVRAITAHADANLGAITYHFGSKEALYNAVFEAVTEPAREMVAEAATTGGEALPRIEQVVRTFFQYLWENPALPNLIAHQLAGRHPLPTAARETMGKTVQLLASLIAEGQGNGTIRSGNPRNMALSIASQPLWLTLARHALRDGTGLDQDDPTTHEQVVESVVQFVLAGLRPYQENRP